MPCARRLYRKWGKKQGWCLRGQTGWGDRSTQQQGGSGRPNSWGHKERPQPPGTAHPPLSCLWVQLGRQKLKCQNAWCSAPGVLTGEGPSPPTRACCPERGPQPRTRSSKGSGGPSSAQGHQVHRLRPHLGVQQVVVRHEEDVSPLCQVPGKVVRAQPGDSRGRCCECTGARRVPGSVVLPPASWGPGFRMLSSDVGPLPRAGWTLCPLTDAARGPV